MIGSHPLVQIHRVIKKLRLSFFRKKRFWATRPLDLTLIPLIPSATLFPRPGRFRQPLSFAVRRTGCRCLVKLWFGESVEQCFNRGKVLRNLRLQFFAATTFEFPLTRDDIGAARVIAKE